MPTVKAPLPNPLRHALRRPQDGALLVLWFVLGIVPSALLFLWIERNCALPWLPPLLGLPWVIVDGTLADWIAFDVGLLLLFGVVHSGLAAPRVRNVAFAFAHPKNHRALYLVATGLTCITILVAWQSTGVVVFHLFRSAVSTTLFSMILFWTLMLVVIRVSEPLGIMEFLGLPDLLRTPEEWKARQSAQPPAATLVTTGAYAKIRHPLYTFTLLAILLTPFLSLDRLVVFVVFLAYILVGYRLEERKLVRQFGAAYETYRKNVPALFPKL